MQSAILTYHSIDTSGSVISTSPSTFQSHMHSLSKSGIRVVSLSQIQQTDGAIAITFDDGFENFEEYALPSLAQYGFSATVFLVSGYSGRVNDWPSQPDRVPRLPLLSWTAIRRLSGPMLEWGAHTVSHPDLTTLSVTDAAHEVRDCRDAIEQHIGGEVKSFAYPYGASNDGTRSLLESEFELACGTRLNYVRAGEQRFDLPRIDSYYLRNPLWLERLFQPDGRAYISARRKMRETRQWLSR